MSSVNFRCEALNFQLSKSQKKVIKKFNKYLKDGILNKNTTQQEHSGDNISELVHHQVPQHVLDKLENNDFVIESDLDKPTPTRDENDSSQAEPSNCFVY